MDWVNIASIVAFIVGLLAAAWGMHLTKSDEALGAFFCFATSITLLCVALPWLATMSFSTFNLFVVRPVAVPLKFWGLPIMLFALSIYLFINAFESLWNRKKVHMLGYDEMHLPRWRSRRAPAAESAPEVTRVTEIRTEETEEAVLPS